MATPALDSAFQKVADFRKHESHYLSPGYQEAEVRKDFIDKFFIALNGNVNRRVPLAK